MQFRVICLVVVLFACLSSALATPQFPDILIYEGKEYPIQNELLEPYFKKYPGRKIETDMVCSALWRGYVAVFEILNSEMVLKNVTTGNCNTPKPFPLESIVPDGRPLKIDWFSGLLLSSYGKNEEDPYSISSLDAYEKYSLFEIDKGSLRAVRHFDNKKYLDFKKRQFQAFKKTAEYDKAVKEMTSGGRMTVKDADWNIMIWLVSYTKSFLVK